MYAGDKMARETILVVNTGSSSVKFGVYEWRDGDECLVVEGGYSGVELGPALDRVAHAVADVGTPAAIGHRVVHGGPWLTEHQAITPRMMGQLKRCEHLAPLHTRSALESMAKMQALYPAARQFACFDTVFHRAMPEAAARFAVPAALHDEGVRRYGFHGLSCESIVHELGSELASRTVIAHLGGGSSVTAVKDGRSADTTMAFTPAAGVPMATRCGDLDPGVALYLMRAKNMSADAIEHMLNHEAGMLALSGGKSDMRELEGAAKEGDHGSQLALDVYCRALAKTVAGYGAVMGGIEMLVFAGGIGEHSAGVRSRVCAALGWLGVEMDETANRTNARGLSKASSRIAVRIVPSQEDRQIARHCRRLMGGRS
jgi:acetate kinase